MRAYTMLCMAVVLGSACGDDGDRPADAGIDAGMDAGVDAGTDAGTDAGPAWIGAGCNLESGVECDGDWRTYCRCGEDECCAPQSGRFSCVPREADGACPAADIWVDTARIEDHVAFEWAFFEPDDCAITEGCVDAPGWRRLLRFDTWTPNTGTADLFLGTPRESTAHFTYSACHDHYHFDGYANYELRNANGTLAAEGHKQAFCLLDFYRYPGENDRGAVYSCAYQGIQRGWQDVYHADLDCQWVDVTDVAPGDYELSIALNVDHVLLESNYDNNTARVPVTVPPDVDPDVTQPCIPERSGLGRACGWARKGNFTCTPGANVTVGCSAACGLGSCRGDTALRVCDAMYDPTCDARRALAANDDSGCRMDDTCSQLTFTCPESGAYVVFSTALDPSEGSATCNVMAR